jgi:hypothetical protein
LSSRTTILALAVAALSGSFGPAAAQRDPRFPLTCQGVLDTRGGQYFFVEGDTPLNADPDDDIICSHVTIAERSTGSALRQSLKEDTIKRLLGVCRVGKSCRVSGLVLNLSHDVYVYVRVDSIQLQ